jgi:polysaccharide biosynthesis transport protein
MDMNDLTHYQNQRALVESDDIFQARDENRSPGMDLLTEVIRQWRMILTVFVVLLAVGLPVIWLVVKPYYVATSAIQVSPVMASLLHGGNEGLPMYRSFMYTQAELIPSDRVLKQAAEDLAARGISLAGDKSDDLQVVDSNAMTARSRSNMVALRAAMMGGELQVVPDDDSQLIKIATKSSSPDRAARISNALVRSYMSTLATDEPHGDEQRVSVLENERKRLEQELKAHNATLYQMASEYGTDILDGRQKLMLDRIGKLQEKLTEFEMERITLEAKIGSLKAGKGGDGVPADVVRLRYEFTNSDPVVQALADRTAQIEKELVAARELMVATNPKLVNKESLLEAIKKRLDERREEVGKRFDTMIVESSKRGDTMRAEALEDQLQQVTASAMRLKEMLAKEDSETIALGRKQLAMQDVQNQMKLTRDLYDTVQRRIKEVEIEGKGPGRVSVAYYASTVPYQDKRTKYSLAFSLFSMMASMGLAVVKSRLDRSVHTTQDMVRHIDVKVLGTTTSRERMNSAEWTLQLEHDYRAICANLDLLEEQGIPRSLVITSPGPGEGKSTMAVQLATNLARQGKKVLLIDGDLRKPDIARMLHLGKRGLGLQQFMSGAKFEDSVSATDIPGLMVLKADPCEVSEVFNYVNRKRAAKFIEKAREVFNHVIIDSPPVLVAVDALVWAKMVDGVIVTNLAGRTKAPELKEALNRLQGINVKVLGTVLGNVSARSAYHPYGYGGYGYKAHGKHEGADDGDSGSQPILPHVSE